jgi:hypothetical protein
VGGGAAAAHGWQHEWPAAGGNTVGEDGGVALGVTSEYGDASEMKAVKESKRRAPHDR